MITRDLSTALKKFLKEPRKSDRGGYAEVTESDLHDFYDVINALLEAKFERDCDGDLPLNVHWVDRTKFYPSHFIDIPYSHKDFKLGNEVLKANSKELYLHIINEAAFNIRQASDVLDTNVRLLKYAK